jgi:peptidoglycan/LPS O-acetylase OafA/YrhL
MAVAGYHMTGGMLHGVTLIPHAPREGMGALQEVLRRLGLALLPAHAALMVFFVISGFVLRVSLEYGPQRLVPAAGKFFLRRLFRIYPVVMLSVLLTAAVAGNQFRPEGTAAQPLTGPRLVANLLLLNTSVNGTLWALQVELLMAPIILLLYYVERGSGPRLLLGIALATTVLAYLVRWAGWPALSTNVFPFVLGMVIPTLGRRFVTAWPPHAATFGVMGAVLALLLAGPCLGLFSRHSAVIEAYAAAVLVSLVAYRHDLAVLRFLDAKGLRLLGLSSGGYYVLHMAAIPPAVALAATIVPPAWSADLPVLVGFLIILVWLGALFPVALASFHLIEAPGIALGQRVIRFCRLDARPDLGRGGQSNAPRVAA